MKKQKISKPIKLKTEWGYDFSSMHPLVQNFQFPHEALSREQNTELKRAAEEGNRTQVKVCLDRVYETTLKVNGTNPDKLLVERQALHFLDAHCFTIDRGYLPIGIPYPPAPIGKVQRMYHELFKGQLDKHFKYLEYLIDWR